MTFLPNGYKEPVTDNYMKFQDGKNVFRVLSTAIVGMEYWKTEINENGEEVRKPIRKRMNENIPVEDLGLDKWGNPERPKHFWAFVVYNRQDEKIQILEVTQSKIRKGIKNFVEDEDWGDPKEYDLVVTRSGEKLETDYVVSNKPKSKIDSAIVKEYEDMKINLEALYDGEDPFKQNEEEWTDKDTDEVAKEV